MRTIAAPLLALLLASPLPACTGQGLYGTGQAYERNQCSKLPDKADYDRCMARAERPR